MECSKEFEIEVLGSCVGLTADQTWEYDPNHASGTQPPAGVTKTENFEGYYGTWTMVRTSGGPNATICEWRTVPSWASVAGKTLRVRCTVVGSVTRGGVGATVRCRANANGNVVDDTVLCLPNVTTQVNLEAIATDATLGGPAFVDIDHLVPPGDTYSLSGEVFVDCF